MNGDSSKMDLPPARLVQLYKERMAVHGKSSIRLEALSLERREEKRTTT
jgi:hypothetical protein